METIAVQAYAKVNLVLNVLGEAAGGYHEIESVMQAIDLCDTVSVSWQPDLSCMVGVYGKKAEINIVLDPGRSDLPADERNLAFRAARLMHEAFHPNMNERVEIAIEKRIPVAAGLAGGSADGAGVISGLARLWHIRDEARLLSVAAALGADVPFCYLAQNGTPAALATGIGTSLRSIAPTPFTVRIETPDFPLSARSVYAELSPRDCEERFNVQPFLWNAPLARKLSCVGNHLTAPALRLRPELAATLCRLQAADNPLAVFMSGSGPACCALYPKGAAIEGAFSAREE